MIDKDVDATIPAPELPQEVRLPWESLDADVPDYAAEAAQLVVEASVARRKKKSKDRSAKKKKSVDASAPAIAGAETAGPADGAAAGAGAVFRTLPPPSTISSTLTTAVRPTEETLIEHAFLSDEPLTPARIESSAVTTSQFTARAADLSSDNALATEDHDAVQAEHGDEPLHVTTPEPSYAEVIESGPEPLAPASASEAVDDDVTAVSGAIPVGSASADDSFGEQDAPSTAITSSVEAPAIESAATTVSGDAELTESAAIIASGEESPSEDVVATESVAATASAEADPTESAGMPAPDAAADLAKPATVDAVSKEIAEFVSGDAEDVLPEAPTLDDLSDAAGMMAHRSIADAIAEIEGNHAFVTAPIVTSEEAPAVDWSAVTYAPPMAETFADTSDVAEFPAASADSMAAKPASGESTDELANPWVLTPARAPETPSRDDSEDSSKMSEPQAGQTSLDPAPMKFRSTRFAARFWPLFHSQHNPEAAVVVETIPSPMPEELVEVEPEPVGPAVSTGGAWTLPLLSMGLGLIACCMVMPQADLNRRINYDKRTLAANLQSIQRQVAVNDAFLRTVMTDPTLAERLASRQMKTIRKGEKVLALKHVGSGEEMSPFSLVAVSPPPAPPAYRPVRGTIANLCNDPRSRIYLLGAALTMAAAGLVLGGAPNKP